MDATTARRKVLYLEISCEREEITSTNERPRKLLPPPLSQSEALLTSPLIWSCLQVVMNCLATRQHLYGADQSLHVYMYRVYLFTCFTCCTNTDTDMQIRTCRHGRGHSALQMVHPSVRTSVRPSLHLSIRQYL